MQLEFFLNKARSIFGYKYDYSKLPDTFLRSDIVTIIHDGSEYQQRISNHLSGKCPERISKAYTNDEFILKSKDVWGDRFEYITLDYINIESKIKIFDKYQGRFIVQKAVDHLKGRESNYMTSEDFINTSRSICNISYDYSETVFINLTTKVRIKCIEHDTCFEVVPHVHFSKGIVCPICDYTLFSKQLRSFLNKRNIRYEEQYRFENDATRFDFYLPKLNLVIDFDMTDKMKDICDLHYVNIYNSSDFIEVRKYLINLLK